MGTHYYKPLPDELVLAGLRWAIYRNTDAGPTLVALAIDEQTARRITALLQTNSTQA